MQHIRGLHTWYAGCIEHMRASARYFCVGGISILGACILHMQAGPAYAGRACIRVHTILNIYKYLYEYRY